MATKSSKNIKLNQKDQMDFLRFQRDKFQIVDQIRALQEQAAVIDQKATEKLNQISKGYKVNPNLYEFDLQALEFRLK